MRLPVLLIVAAVAVGCADLLGGPDVPIQVDSEFVFQVREAHTVPEVVGPPEPMLFLVTAKQLECYNYKILARVKAQGGVLQVDVLGMDLPGGLCLTAFGPARAQIGFPSLPECTGIVFKYGGEVDEYSVAMDEMSIHISGQEGRFTRPGDTLVWRFPRESMVYTCGTLTEDSCLCQQFRDSLLAHLDLQPIEVPPTGYWPYPRETSGYYYNMSALVYRYSSESDFQRAGELLVAFTRATLSDRQGVGLALDNWRNEQHASWLVRDSTIPRQ